MSKIIPTSTFFPLPSQMGSSFVFDLVKAEVSNGVDSRGMLSKMGFPEVPFVWNFHSITARQVTDQQDKVSSAMGRGSLPETVFQEIRQLGYKNLDRENIQSSLAEIEKRYGKFGVSAGIAMGLAEDFSGLWPTSAFREAVLENNLGEYLKEEFKAYGQHYPFDDALDQRQRFNMIASYLAPTKEDLPWQSEPESRLVHAIFQILLLETRMYGKEKSFDSLEDMYLPAEAFDRDNVFRNTIHLWGQRPMPLPMLPMPLKALRLSVELIYPTLINQLKQVASCLAKVAMQGFHLSAKQTISDLRPHQTTGARVCIYVPTCALPVYLSAMKECGFGDGELGDVDPKFIRVIEYTDAAVLFPNFVSLRTNREGGDSSPTQIAEMIQHVKESQIKHKILSGERVNI